MPRKRVYANAHERVKAAGRRRVLREGTSRIAVAKMLEGRRAAEASRAHLAHLEVVRQRQLAEQHAGSEAVALYRSEKARSEERNATKYAETMAAVKRAIARADAEAVELGRGGRPKGEPPAGKKRGRGIFIRPRRADPVNALCDALGADWRGAGA